ncbi:hypothetical protein [Microbacterium sp.]|uniref:hypothetical protein n=1 Tax=Microbacterium sp. TaxID=51671 RepID=UPI0028ADEC13|nr:hypothetical protein [Microbacterium sp.]
MKVETTGGRRSAVYLWGALFVLAWALLSAVFAGGEARADDEAPTPLSGLTSLVGDTLGGGVAPVAKAATTTVEHVAAPVVPVVEQVVAKTTTTVASVPVVGAPTAHVIAQTGETVSNVTQTVEDVAASTPVSSIVTPVTDAVSGVPVLGTVLDGLGATDLVDELATGVDEVLDIVPPVIDSTVTPVVDGLQPSIPGSDDAGLPELDRPLDDDAVTPGVDSAAEPAAEIEAVTAVTHTAQPAASALPVVSHDNDWTPPDAGVQQSAPSGDLPGAPASAPAASPASAAGSGGPASGATSDRPSSARVDIDASSRTGIPADAALPASPAGGTDVSPD